MGGNILSPIFVGFMHAKLTNLIDILIHHCIICSCFYQNGCELRNVLFQTECAYTTDEMMRIFETLTFEEDVDVTEDDNDVDDDDDDDDYDLGRSIGIPKKCRKFCKRPGTPSNVWIKPLKCSKLKKKSKYAFYGH